MSRGKYLSLEEARKADQLKQFCKEHPSWIMNQKVDEKEVPNNFYGKGNDQKTTAS